MQKLNTLLDQKSHSTWRLFSSASVRSRSTVRETEGNALIDMDSKLGKSCSKIHFSLLAVIFRLSWELVMQT